MSRARRYTIASMLFVGATVATMSAFTTRDRAESTAAAAVTINEPSDRWLDGLKAPNKQFFDSPAPGGGIPLVHILNYYNTYNQAYKVKDADIDAVGTFYGMTTFFGLNDAMWAKYRLGEFLGEKTGKGVVAVANPWRTAPEIIGMTIPDASIETLQKRGATFILCNNALSIFSGLLAKQRGLDPKVVYEDMKANILPGVTLVPGMVIAIEQAHKANLSYHRQ